MWGSLEKTDQLGSKLDPPFWVTFGDYCTPAGQRVATSMNSNLADVCPESITGLAHSSEKRLLLA